MQNSPKIARTDSPEVIRGKLRRAGLRATDARTAILRGLLGSRRSLNAYRLHELLQTQGEVLELSTIYRNLESLSQVGLIHFIGSDQGYVACKTEHDQLTVQHFVCDNCNKVEEVALKEELGQSIRNGLVAEGRVVRQISVEVLGTCKICANL